MNRLMAWLCWGICGVIVAAISNVGLLWTTLAIVGIVLFNSIGDEFYDRRDR